MVKTATLERERSVHGTMFKLFQRFQRGILRTPKNISPKIGDATSLCCKLQTRKKACKLDCTSQVFGRLNGRTSSTVFHVSKNQFSATTRGHISRSNPFSVGASPQTSPKDPFPIISAQHASPIFQKYPKSKTLRRITSVCGGNRSIRQINA